jgi:hypothetical protein
MLLSIFLYIFYPRYSFIIADLTDRWVSLRRRFFFILADVENLCMLITPLDIIPRDKSIRYIY